MSEHETRRRHHRREGPYFPATLLDWSPIDTLRRQFDWLFDGLPHRRGDFDRGESHAGWPMSPAIDFVEKDPNYEIDVELPGLSDKDVEVRLAGASLIISGEKREERDEMRDGHIFAERRFGSFRRSLRLPDDVDPDGIDAHFDRGVLKIRLRKTGEAVRRDKRIEIGPRRPPQSA